MKTETNLHHTIAQYDQHFPPLRQGKNEEFKVQMELNSAHHAYQPCSSATYKPGTHEPACCLPAFQGPASHQRAFCQPPTCFPEPSLLPACHLEFYPHSPTANQKPQKGLISYNLLCSKV
ncbi:hypothetical protein DSO57_1012569 [Entomophthora muscae]|uniref:Uncharacterized protein n=1 Tax=Entomophthora muscae TaxID=34485 RepID=A0ACC2UGR4_9FUNG|nr:hypothetical protein DSO57_1012569 [Entomophthora muscae]